MLKRRTLDLIQKKLKSGFKTRDYTDAVVPDLMEGKATLQLIDVKTDTSSRMVEGYLSAFKVIDSDLDMIMKGSFSRSIAQHGPDSPKNRRIAHLSQHEIKTIIGKFQELKEDEHGLYFRSKMGTHTDGEDHLRMYKEGLIREHSIGFNYISDAIEYVEDPMDENKSYFEITDLKLWEGSAVTFGANSETPNLSEGKAFKSQVELNDFIDTINERMDVFIKALRDGRYSEKFNNMAEMELYQLKSQYNALIAYEPDKSIRTTEQESTDDNEKSDKVKSLFNQIITK